MFRRACAVVTLTLVCAAAITPPSHAEDAVASVSLAGNWSGAPSASVPDDSGDDLKAKDPFDITPFDFRGTGPQGACRLVVWDVGWDQAANWLGIQGGRENCENYASFNVELRKDLRLRPDPLIGSVRGVNNQIVRAFGACQGSGLYYGKVTSSTGRTLRGDNSGACR